MTVSSRQLRRGKAIGFGGRRHCRPRLDFDRVNHAALAVLRIASPEMFPEAEMLPHLICSRPMFIDGAKDEADQHGGA